MNHNIQIVSAPSILGLRPGGVALLSRTLLQHGLREKLRSGKSVVEVTAPNSEYRFDRDPATQCLNPQFIHRFSIALMEQITKLLRSGTFPVLLGGDCSILIGAMPALKSAGESGLIFMDAHADFYEPSESPSGEVADMDLGIVTGCGPDLLTNIRGLKPYVKEAHVIHVGQRDGEETKQYGSREIKDSLITCFDLDRIRAEGLDDITGKIVRLVEVSGLDGFWIHFDTDALSDDDNPAVDYRLPGGLTFREAAFILRQLIATNRMKGLSITIYNPTLDADGSIADKICDCIAEAF